MRQLSVLRLVFFVLLTVVTVSMLWAATTPAEKAFETAQQLAERGHDQEAIEEFDKYLKAYPTDAHVSQAYLTLGAIYQRQQAYDKAMEALSKVLVKATTLDDIPLRGEAYFRQGECYQAQRDYEKAVQAFDNFMKVSGKFDLTKKDADFVQYWTDLTVRAQYWLAESKYQLGPGKYDEALRDFGKVITIAPTHPLAAWASYSRGMIELNRGRYAESIVILEQLIKDYKGSEISGEASFALGFAYAGRARATQDAGAKTADFQHAVQVLSAVLTDDKVTATTKQQAALTLAQVYAEQGDVDNAQANYTLAIQLMGKDSGQALETRLQQGHVYYNAKRYADAGTIYAEVAAQRKSPALASQASFWLAMCSYQQAEGKNNAQAFRDIIAALTKFLTPPGDKDEKASSATLLLAICYEDLTNLGDKPSSEKAIEYFKQVLTRWPGSDQAAQARAGLTRMMRDMTPEQLRQLSGILPTGAASWDVALQLAYKEFTAGNYKAALTAANQVLEGKPAADIAAQANYIIGAVQQKLGSPEKAIPYYQQVLTNQNSALVPYAQRALVLAYSELKKYTEARDAAQALLKTLAQDKAADVADKQAEAYTLLAAAYLGNQQIPEALAAYRKVITDYPKSSLAPDALLNIAYIQEERQKDEKAATATYQEFVATFGKDKRVGDAYLRLGANLLQQKDYARAIEALKNVPAQSEAGAQAAYSIAWAYFSQQKVNEANAQFTLVAEKYQDSPYAVESLYHLGDAKAQAEDYPAAMQYFDRALAASKDAEMSALIAFRLGSAAFQSKQYQAASTAYNKAIVASPNGQYAADARFWKAVCLEQQGGDQAVIARDAYQEYLTKYPTGDLVADAALGLGRAAVAAKQYTVARDDLQKAITLFEKLEDGDNKDLAERAKGLKAEAQYTIGQSYYEEKNYKQAIREFAQVSLYKYEPWYSRSFLQEARCDVQLGDKESAVKSLRLLINTLPGTEGAKQAPALAEELGLQL